MGKTTEQSIRDVLESLVQGVQEIPRLPKVKIDDNEGIKRNMEHYYSQRAKWIDQTLQELLNIIEGLIPEKIDVKSKEDKSDV